MGFYKSFKEFQEYYANKFQRNNPLPWQDGMQAIIWWITENLPENTQATVEISGAPTGVSISGKGVDGDPYIWAFNFNRNDVKGDTGPQGPAGPQGETGPQGPAGQDGTIVEANPQGTASGNLNKIGINGTVYAIPSGGGGLYKHHIYATDSSYMLEWDIILYLSTPTPLDQIDFHELPNEKLYGQSLIVTSPQGKKCAFALSGSYNTGTGMYALQFLSADSTNVQTSKNYIDIFTDTVTAL